MYYIIEPKYFKKAYKKFFDLKEIEKFSKFKAKLKNYPYIGDMLRVPYVREFKTPKGKRAYFVINEKNKTINFVAISDKKNQNTIIKFIFKNLDKYSYEI